MTSPVMVVPDALQALLDLSKVIGKVGLPQQTLDLVHLREPDQRMCRLHPPALP